MKTIWARVGMSVEVTDEQYEEVRKLALNDKGFYEDLEDFPDWLDEKFEKEGKIDGDYYIPETYWW